MDEICQLLEAIAADIQKGQTQPNFAASDIRKVADAIRKTPMGVYSEDMYSEVSRKASYFQGTQRALLELFLEFDRRLTATPELS